MVGRETLVLPEPDGSGSPGVAVSRKREVAAGTGSFHLQ